LLGRALHRTSGFDPEAFDAPSFVSAAWCQPYQPLTSHHSPALSALFLPGELKSPKQLSGQRYFCDDKPTRQEKQKPRIQFRTSSQIGPNCRVNEYGIGDELGCAQQVIREAIKSNVCSRRIGDIQ